MKRTVSFASIATFFFVPLLMADLTSMTSIPEGNSGKLESSLARTSWTSPWPLKQPPWQLGPDVGRIVGTDITDTRFGWDIPTSLAGPLDGEPIDSSDEESGEDVWDELQGQGEAEFSRKSKDPKWLRRVWNCLPPIVKAKLEPLPEFWHADGKRL